MKKFKNLNSMPDRGPKYYFSAGNNKDDLENSREA